MKESSERLNAEAVAAFADTVPQTYGEAVALWGAETVNCAPHEWDNRTTLENTQWLLRRLLVLCPHHW